MAIQVKVIGETVAKIKQTSINWQPYMYCNRNLVQKIKLCQTISLLKSFLLQFNGDHKSNLTSVSIQFLISKPWNHEIGLTGICYPFLLPPLFTPERWWLAVNWPYRNCGPAQLLSRSLMTLTTSFGCTWKLYIIITIHPSKSSSSALCESGGEEVLCEKHLKHWWSWNRHFSSSPSSSLSSSSSYEVGNGYAVLSDLYRSCHLPPTDGDTHPQSVISPPSSSASYS